MNGTQVSLFIKCVCVCVMYALSIENSNKTLKKHSTAFCLISFPGILSLLGIF